MYLDHKAYRKARQEAHKILRADRKEVRMEHKEARRESRIDNLKNKSPQHSDPIASERLDEAISDASRDSYQASVATEYRDETADRTAAMSELNSEIKKAQYDGTAGINTHVISNLSATNTSHSEVVTTPSLYSSGFIKSNIGLIVLVGLGAYLLMAK